MANKQYLGDSVYAEFDRYGDPKFSIFLLTPGQRRVRYAK
jgi:hypothetical protein